MATRRIKVPGYTRTTTYLGDIEYRNFSPDLVGFQIASDGGTPLFTLGNFSITTNLDPKRSKVFATTKFSNFVSLTDLDLSLDQAYSLLQNNAGVILNLDKRRLSNYVLFSSFKEYVRVALEDIILNWPAALYINSSYAIPPDFLTQSGFTFENNYYNPLTQESTFKINVNTISNQYEINYLKNGTLGGTFNEKNKLRNLTLEYESYSILLNNVEYDVLGFTGSTYTLNDFIFFRVKGNPFSGNTNGFDSFHVKPNSTQENLFFNSLPDFEYYLLNRLVTPKYTATFNFTIKTDAGPIIRTQESITWPTTDGYNLDFDTDAYEEYATTLLNISDNYDLSTSNLMVRFLVTESITGFDTAPIHLSDADQDTSEQKVNKTLVIYGREYDDLNQYINGIKFANAVSYNKQDNVPDVYLKNIARVMGWELISSVLQQNLLKNYIEPKPSTYQGQSVGLTPVEADIELWRRIILNSPWLWKSKGTRKGIEFLFKFIGTPLGLIQFNEYIYVAENNIDFDDFLIQLNQNNIPTNNVLTRFPVDIDGYPNPFPNTSSLYYQGLGLWYRETGGYSASVDINVGNNPHVGPYDGGYRYINQFRQLIPNYSAVTISSQTVTTNTDNIFVNYNSGTITGYSGKTYVDITTADGADFSKCYVVKSEIILDPKERQDQTNCGCDIPENLKSLSICIDRNEGVASDCSKEIASFGFNQSSNYSYQTYQYYQYNIDGSIYTVNGTPKYYESIFVDPKCCKLQSVPYNEVDSNGKLINSGFICCSDIDCGYFVTCKWTVDEQIRKVELPVGSGIYYLVFKDELGANRITSYNGVNCMLDYSTPVTVTDPYTNTRGVACQLNPNGIFDLSQIATLSNIIQTYGSRASGTIPCSGLSIRQQIPQPSVMFGVILNDANQIGKRVNNLLFNQINPSVVGGNFANSNVQLSGNPNGVGYMYGYTPQNLSYNSTIEMQIITATTIGGTSVDIAFNPSLGHKMYYLQTNVKYDSSTFGTILNSLGEIQVSSKNVQNIGYYYSRFPYNFISNPMYTYMVWDFRNKPTVVQQNKTYCYTITNINSKEQFYSWTDASNNSFTASLQPNTVIGKCAKLGSVVGNSLQISGGTNECTSNNDCSVANSGALFVVLNQTISTVNSVTSNGLLLPFAAFSNYPVRPNTTASGLRNVNITGRITLNLTLAETTRIELRVNNTLVQTITENLSSLVAISNYTATFNLVPILSSDVITITLKPVVVP